MKLSKRLLSLLMTATMVVGMSMTALAEYPKDIRDAAIEDMSGKTVILHSNDVHGAISGYAKIAQLKKDFVAKGAEVLMVDAGDYIQGETTVNINQGLNAIILMNAAGYDVATIGNHEFDYGTENLKTIMEQAKFKVVCANVTQNGQSLFDPGVVLGEGVKIGFFGMDTPETVAKAHPGKLAGASFNTDLSGVAVKTSADLKAEGAELVICLAHLGVDDESAAAKNRSSDMYAGSGVKDAVDFILDGHSHTEMTGGENKEPIQSTGTKFANIGVVVIDQASKKIESNYLIKTESIEGEDKDIADAVKAINDEIKEAYGKVVGKTTVKLNGDRDPGNRTEETNLGDLITDAMMWAVRDVAENEVDTYGVAPENMVAITNGGGIRAAIEIGDITKQMIHDVLPFGNTVAVEKIKGETLLRILEASTFCTPTAIGGFPQIAGMDISINVAKMYVAKDEPFKADSPYFGPELVNRVTINSVNGKDFDPNAEYLLITNDFISNGGDTYFEVTAEGEDKQEAVLAYKQLDYLVLDEVLESYITEKLGGTVGDEYKEPAGRITIIAKEAYETQVNFDLIMSSLAKKDAYVDFSAVDAAKKAMDEAKEDADNLDAMKKALSDLVAAVKALEFKNSSFADADANAWYDEAVDYVSAAGLMNGTDAGFEPDGTMSRGMVATVIHRLENQPAAGDAAPFTDLTQDWYKNAVNWAFNKKIVTGESETTFNPAGNIKREQMAAILVRYLDGDYELGLTPTYSDASEISDYAKGYVARATQLKLMQGSGNMFRPQANMKRAECAQVLYNIYKNHLDLFMSFAK